MINNMMLLKHLFFSSLLCLYGMALDTDVQGHMEVFDGIFLYIQETKLLQFWGISVTIP